MAAYVSGLFLSSISQLPQNKSHHRAASKDLELEAIYLKLLREPSPHEKSIIRDLGRFKIIVSLRLRFADYKLGHFRIMPFSRMGKVSDRKISSTF